MRLETVKVDSCLAKVESIIFGSDRSSRKANLRSFVRPFVRPSGLNLSKALNLHLLTS